jgi:hypothetical protein
VTGAILWLALGLAVAQDRPSEADLFGAPPTAEEKPAPPGEAPPPREEKPKPGAQTPEAQEAPPDPRLEPSATDPAERVGQRLGETENPLAIGGQLYLRSSLAARDGEPPSAWSFTAPSLVDAYLDARPSDRVRGFLLARMQYDPTTDPAASRPTLPGSPAAPPQEPTRIVLDQLWLRFDVEKVAFLTVGKQHVKWGTGRFWNPTDFLHVVRRDPVAVFDPRTGTAMVRVHVPWERLGWNFHGIAIVEPLTTSTATGQLDPATAQPSPQAGQAPLASPTAQRVGGVGGALRAELVLGPGELGLGAVVQRGHRPRFAVDASAPFLDVDLYGEAALQTGSEVPVFRRVPGASGAFPFASYEPAGVNPQLLGGARWAHRYSDQDSFELGAEYFWNRLGYDETAIYPTLFLANAFTPFYLGRHYAGAYALLPNPGSWNQTTFILSLLGNLSDRSYLARLDYAVLLLTYLRLEAFGQARLGAERGEFRLGFTEFGLRPSTFDLGLALRVSL